MRACAKFGVLVALIAGISLPSRASTLLTVILTGSQEIPATGSTATGFGSILLNDAQDMMTINENWSGLSTPAVASHIHIAPAFGANGPVVFPFAGVPAAISGAIPEQSFAVTQAQVAALFQGLWYFNVHSTNFPGGEIRGNVVAPIPEPGTICLLGAGLLAVGLWRRR